MKIEHRVKALVVLNLQSYGGGRDVFGLGSSPDSLALKGFQVPIFNDGHLEVNRDHCLGVQVLLVAVLLLLSVH